MGLISLLWHKYGDRIIKSFTLEAVDKMKMGTFNAKSVEVLSPMDAYITVVEAGVKELNLLRKEMDKNKKGSTDTKEITRPNPMFL